MEARVWSWLAALLLLLLHLQGAPRPCGAVRYHGGALRWEVAPSADPEAVTVNFVSSVSLNGSRCDLTQTWSCSNGCPKRHFAVAFSCGSGTPSYAASSWGTLAILEAAFALQIQRDSVTDVMQRSCCWNSEDFVESGFVTVQRNADFVLSTFVDLRTRNDTGQPNSSPRASIAHLVRVSNQCQTNVKIQVSDPDGDSVRCRYARGPECYGGICGTFPNARLWEDRCEFEFFGQVTDQLPKQFGVMVVVEDFPTSVIETKGTCRTPVDCLSSVTLQFSVLVAASDACISLVFVDPTPSQGAVVNAHVGVRLQIPIAVTARASSDLETVISLEVVVLSGKGVPVGIMERAPENAHVHRTLLLWTPSATDAGARWWTCFYVLTLKGWQGELRCITIVVPSGPVGVPDPLQRLRAAIKVTPVPTTLMALRFSVNIQKSGAMDFTIFFNQQFVPALPTAYIRFHLVEDGALVYKINAADQRLVKKHPGNILTFGIPAGALSARCCLQLDPGVVQDVFTTPGRRLDSAAHDACDWILPVPTAVGDGGRGFLDDFNVSCVNEHMIVKIPQGAIFGYNASSLKLNTQATGCDLRDEQQFVTFNISFGDCGTVFEETATDLVFTQMVSLASSTSYIVTYDYQYVLVNCTCKVPRTKLLSQGPLEPTALSLVFNQTVFSLLDLRMDFFTDSGFETPFLPSQYPLLVSLGAAMYLQVSVKSTLNVTIFTVDCYATPDSSPQHPDKYYLIQEGCLLANMTNLTSVDTKRRFHFRMFTFTATARPNVYIHCAVVACKSSAIGSRCYQGCLLPRTKRSPLAVVETPIYIVSRGPFHFDAETSGRATVNSRVLWGTALAVLVVLVLGLVLKFTVCFQCLRNPSKART
ncbi:uncharacterized protein LOC116947035 [Petromyzon marinus]|uniref:uncharacterized protein LOC116947035 n=1 Tax=Petromyzon marinus TaxID=7757 RepID=UPI003F6F96DB